MPFPIVHIMYFDDIHYLCYLSSTHSFIILVGFIVSFSCIMSSLSIMFIYHHLLLSPTPFLWSPLHINSPPFTFMSDKYIRQNLHRRKTCDFCPSESGLFNMTISSFIHFFANDIISFFFMTE
jgi:disulfide bond formation protein DsbB